MVHSEYVNYHRVPRGTAGALEFIRMLISQSVVLEAVVSLWKKSNLLNKVFGSEQFAVLS